MPKSLINLTLWFRALVAALSVFRRSRRADGSLTLPAAPQSQGRNAHAPALTCVLNTLFPAGGALGAAPASAFARGLVPQACPPRGATPRGRARPGLAPGRAGSTTAFGLFDATRERGMGHPAG